MPPHYAPLLFGALCLSITCAGCKVSTPPAAAAPHATLTSALDEPSSLKERMRDHAAHGTALRDAVARGDLAAARRAAQLLAELRPSPALASALRHDLAAMNAAAERVLTTDDLAEASTRVAVVAQTCGSCHATLGGAATVDSLEDDLAIMPPKKRHAWAAARLWTGLAAPSDLAWKAGASVLADAPLEHEPVTLAATQDPSIGDLAASVHDLGHEAKVTGSTADRTAVLGEVFATCARCHARR